MTSRRESGGRPHPKIEMVAVPEGIQRHSQLDHPAKTLALPCDNAEEREAVAIVRELLATELPLQLVDRLADLGQAPGAPKQEAALARDLAEVARRTSDDFILSSVIDWLLSPLLPEDILAELPEFFRVMGRWGACGLPVVRLTGKQAAALALSDIADEVVAEVRAPWRSFRIVLDEPWPLGGDGDEVMAVHVAEMRAAALPVTRWIVRCETARGFILVRSRPLADLLHPTEAPRPLSSLMLRRPDDREGVNDAEARAIELLCQLALNVALALAQTGQHRRGAGAPGHGRGKKARKAKRRPSRVVQLDFPVAVDMREHVADYLSGEVHRVYKMRWVVRGHWRNQPHGPARRLRKRIWIAPHWKGPTADAMHS